MEWDGYDIIQGVDDHRYYFYSIGPKGWIRKAVTFQRMESLGPNAYNLLVGDVEEGTDKIDSSVVSNNEDYKSVLRTVAWIVEIFVDLHPRAIIFIRGLTASRTRLYQMGISLAWLEISHRFEIWGRQGAKKWSQFEKGVNYEEFLAFKKIS